MRTATRSRAVLAMIALCAGPASATPAPKEAIVTREAQDLYRAGTGSFYIKTVNCHEQIYGDRVTLRMNLGIRGGMMTTRAGRVCVIDKLLREVSPATMQPVEIF